MQSRSHFLRHEQCPACAANGKDRGRNNLGIYSDGGTHCFSCGYSSGGSIRDRIKKQEKVIQTIPPLPEDITNKLGQEAYEWLLQYFEPKDFPRCLYSKSERKLYFMLESGAYQYRYFGNNPKHPKWKSYGISENYIHITNPISASGSSMERSSATIVLVEDIISGVKVGHITPTLTLFGSNISLKRLATLKLLGYKTVIIWLDWDKKEYSIKTGNLARSIGLHAHIILTKLDPKEYSYDFIKKELLE